MLEEIEGVTAWPFFVELNKTEESCWNNFSSNKRTKNNKPFFSFEDKILEILIYKIYIWKNSKQESLTNKRSTPHFTSYIVPITWIQTLRECFIQCYRIKQKRIIKCADKIIHL